MSDKTVMLNRLEAKLLRDKTKEVSKKMTIAEELAKWFLNKGEGHKLVRFGEAVDKITSMVNEGTLVTRNCVGSYIGNVRMILETKHGKTLWNVRGEGWQIANDNQTATNLVRAARNTIKMAERTQRLYVITKKNEIPGAIKYVFGSSAKAQEQVAQYNKQFNKLFKRQIGE